LPRPNRTGSGTIADRRYYAIGRFTNVLARGIRPTMTDHAAWLERVRATWDERAPQWDEMSEGNATAPDRPADLARTAAALGLQPGARLLDAGCGSGQYAIAFAQLGYRVTAIDLAPAMIARARRHAEERRADVAWRTGDLSRLADPDAFYDAIHARMVLQFAPDVPAALLAIRRVLKPDGRLYASVPGALSPVYNRSWRRFIDPGSVSTSYMTPWELEEVLHALGWTILDGWGHTGRNLTGDENLLDDSSLQRLPLRLRQAAATSWAVIATAAGSR
jgi:2-polyprenyl-3-methyl-5-hydroxy-6-metoxy-1,4-benzoquinol methylase